MATSAIAGYKGVFAASTATGQTPASLSELRDFTVSVEHTEIDATSHDSSGSREVIGGTDQWSGTADLLHVQSDQTHKDTFDVLVGKTKVDLEFYPTGSSSDGYYSGSGFFTGFELGSPNEDALNTRVSFVGTGALARTSSA